MVRISHRFFFSQKVGVKHSDRWKVARAGMGNPNVRYKKTRDDRAREQVRAAADGVVAMPPPQRPADPGTPQSVSPLLTLLLSCH